MPYVALEVSEEALLRLESSGVAASVHEDSLAEPALDGDGTKVVSEACYSLGQDCPGGVTAKTGPGSGVPCTYETIRCSHGTHLAGVAAGRGSSFSGVARDARLISIQVFSRFDGPANCPNPGPDPCALSFASDQLAALQRVYALRNTHSIAAVVLGVAEGNHVSHCNGDPRKAAIDNLRAARISTVVPSGNDGFSNQVGAPGCIVSAVTVGATDGTTVALFSNTSTLVDFFAPGVAVNSSVTPAAGDFASRDGTSAAAAHVAGAWAVAKQTRPSASVNAVVEAINATGVPITDTFASPQVTRDQPRVFSASTYLLPTGFRAANDFRAVYPGAGLVSDGVGLADRTTGAGTRNSTFQISGIPGGAKIRAAFLVWQTIGGPDRVARFKGVDRTGTLVGGSENPC